MTPAVALTRTLVAFNTVNPPGNEDQCCQFLADLLRPAGFQCTLHEFAPRRTSLVARIGGAADRLPICFTGHVDVVPLGAAAWDVDPFAGEIVDGKLFGRGASDMKSGVAAFVTVALELAEALKRGPGMVLVVTAGEETGCEGAFDLARKSRLGDVLGEAGALVVAEPTGNYPLIGHKGAFWLKASTAGVTAHGSMPERGDNAIYKMARAVSALEAYRFPPESVHPLLGTPTLNVGTIRGGLNINSVPDAAEIGIDLRTTPRIEHSELRRCLGACLGPAVTLETLVDVPAVDTDPEQPWVRRVFAFCEALHGAPMAPRSVSYFTDASALREIYADAPVLILGPGEAHMAHQTNEYCLVRRIDEAVDLYRQIVKDWCAC